MISRLTRLLAAAFLLALLAAPASATEDFDCLLPETGLTEADLTLVFAVDGVDTVDPGYTLTEIGGGDGVFVYRVEGFPNPDPGSSYSVTLISGGLGCSWTYPSQGNAPQPFIYQPTVILPPGSSTIVSGDTLPAFLPVIKDFASDPTGSTVTVTWYRDATGTATVLVDEPAEIVAGSAVSYPAPPTNALAWRATFAYRWRPTDTATLLGATASSIKLYARFHLVLPVSNCGDGDDSCELTVPAAKQASVTVVR